MRRLVVFRFDRDPVVCRERIAVIRRLNPEVPVHGLYGGPLGARAAAVRALANPLLGLDTVFLSAHDIRWNWKNGDLALLDWFRQRGRHLPFDVLYLVEWDLLLLEPLAAAYAAVPDDAVGLTALAPLTDVPSDWRWTTGTAEWAEFEALLRHVRQRWHFVGIPRACIGVGPCFPRQFLEAYAAADPPEWGNDELRLPLYCDVLGYPAADSGLVSGWAAIKTGKSFNVGGRPVDPADVLDALDDSAGPRVFHPVRARVPALRRRLGRMRSGNGHESR